MTSPSMIPIRVVAGSLLALACKYSSPDPAVSNTSTESPGSTENTAPKRSSSEPGEAKSTPDDAKRAPTEASGTCDDRACVASSDCCGGYQCGFDPERSKVQRYCLPQ